MYLPVEENFHPLHPHQYLLQQMSQGTAEVRAVMHGSNLKQAVCFE